MRRAKQTVLVLLGALFASRVTCADPPTHVIEPALSQRQSAAPASEYALPDARLQPAVADPDWHIPHAGGVDAAELRAAHPDYVRLEQVLARYRTIARAGGWPRIPPGPELQAGMRDERVMALRNHLRITGDYDAEMQADPYYFDAAVDAALRHFQTRHGLLADGLLEEETRAELNVPVQDRIRQIAIALQRWHWLPRNLGERYVWVNLPAAGLAVVEHGKPALHMRAIVGRPYRATPSFAGTIRRIVFNPTWTVPRTVAVEDLLPQQRNDPQFLARKHIRVFDVRGAEPREVSPMRLADAGVGTDYFPYRLRQDAGPDNSLGRIKFELDNPFDIYLHDTPATPLFVLPGRAFSSGCVRVESPVALAQYLLAHDGSDAPIDVSSRIERSDTSTVVLRTPVPIYFVYLTTWVEADGTVSFRPDLYGRDRRLLQVWGR